jgi:hypothetical protein
MATTGSRKSDDSSDKSAGNASKSGSASGKSGSSTAAGRKTSGSRSASTGNRGSSRSSASSNGRGRQDGLTLGAVQLSTAVASLIGVGVALGVGLFATRRRWLPYADDVNAYLHDRWSHDGQDRYSDYSDSDDLSTAASDDDEWSASPSTTSGPFTTTGTAGTQNSDAARIGL